MRYFKFYKNTSKFQREVRYISLTFFDFRNARAIDNASIYRFMNETSGAITKDVLDIQNILTTMSTAMEREKCKQKSIVADILIRIFPKIKMVKNIAFFLWWWHFSRVDRFLDNHTKVILFGSKHWNKRKRAYQQMCCLTFALYILFAYI